MRDNQFETGRLRPVSSPYSIFSTLVRLCSFVLVFAALAVAYVAIRSQNTAMDYKIERVGSELGRMKIEFDTLKMRKDKLESYARLDSMAADMGLGFPRRVVFLESGLDYSGSTAWEPNQRRPHFRE